MSPSSSMSEILEAARLLAGLTNRDLWLRYYAIGGQGSPETLGAVLAGIVTPAASDYDVIAQALNDRFIDQRSNHPVPYADELDWTA